MSLADGYTDLPPGKLANVVTCLEMRARPAERPQPQLLDLHVERFTQPDLARFHALARRVGEPYLWQSPLLMTQEQLSEQLRDGRIEFYALQRHRDDEGILVQDFRQDGECEIRLFGVSEALRGTGAGRMLMNYALATAWSR